MDTQMIVKAWSAAFKAGLLKCREGLFVCVRYYFSIYEY